MSCGQTGILSFRTFNKVCWELLQEQFTKQGEINFNFLHKSLVLIFCEGQMFWDYCPFIWCPRVLLAEI